MKLAKKLVLEVEGGTCPSWQCQRCMLFLLLWWISYCAKLRSLFNTLLLEKPCCYSWYLIPAIIVMH